MPDHNGQSEECGVVSHIEGPCSQMTKMNDQLIMHPGGDNEWPPLTPSSSSLNVSMNVNTSTAQTVSIQKSTEGESTT